MGVLAASAWSPKNSADRRIFAGEKRCWGWDLLKAVLSCQSSVLRQLNFQRPSRGFCSKRSSRFAGCALAFGRVELFIFKSLTARMNPCPDKHALGLHSKGSAAKTRLLRPRKKFARFGAHFSLTRSKGSATQTGNEFSKTGFILRAPQPKQGCYALAKSSRDPALTFAHPVLRTPQSRPATNFQRPALF